MRFVALLALLVCSCAEQVGAPNPDRADLPNDELEARPHDGKGYREIAEHFADLGFNTNTNVDDLNLRWPVSGSARTLLTRFGTPVQLADWAYFHTALDILGTADEQRVLAPVSGMAMLFDWDGNPGYHGSDMVPGSFLPRGNYSTVVAIWDPLSKGVVQLMHVSPVQELIDATDPVPVEVGQVLGSFAPIPSPQMSEADRLRYQHTHLSVVDGSRMEALNPIDYTDYRDQVSPEFVGSYLLDEDAEITSAPDGPVDLVVEVFDRDDDSERNFEIGAVAFELRDSTGTRVASLERCNLNELFSDITLPTFNTVDVLDFGNARHQIGRGGWPRADTADPERTFRYALTQLTHTSEGRCSALADAEGSIVLAGAEPLQLDLRLWDQSGNLRELSHEISVTP